MSAATGAAREFVRPRSWRAGRDRTRAFRRYLAVAGSAGLAAFAVFYAASCWLVATHVRPNDSLYQSLALLSAPGSDGATFGDSHAAVDVTGDRSFLNLAYPSEGVADMAERLDRYLRATPHPRRLLIEADAQLFSAYRLAAPKNGYFGDVQHFWIIGPRDRGYLLRYWRVFLRQGVIASDAKITATGWMDVATRFDDASPAERRDLTQGRVRLHAPADGAGAAAARAAYEALLDRAKESGASLCLVTFPGSRDYVEALRRLPGSDAVYAFFADAARRHGARYVDLGYRFAGAGDISYFSDPDHLNEDGARLLYPEIVRRCFETAER
jgi:hypothetical protein